MGHVADHAIDKVMNAGSYAGAGVSVFFGLTLTEWGILVGIATALLTFIINYVYQLRKERREADKERREKIIHDLQVMNLCKTMPMAVPECKQDEQS